MTYWERKGPRVWLPLLTWVACTLALVVVAGCENAEKQDAAVSPALADTSGSRHVASGGPMQAADQEQPQEPKKAEEPKKAAEPKKDPAPGKDAKASDDKKPMTLDELATKEQLPDSVSVDQLAEMIRQRALEEQAQQPVAQNPAPQNAPGQARPQPTAGGQRPVAQQDAEQEKHDSEDETTAKRSGGCGGTTGSITPPPEDQPQPKLVVDEPVVEGEPVWAGDKMTFTWKVQNAGEGPLEIGIKKG